MGKLQSKHAAAARKRRESPEGFPRVRPRAAGDSFVASAYASGRKGAEETERRARDKQGSQTDACIRKSLGYEERPMTPPGSWGSLRSRRKQEPLLGERHQLGTKVISRVRLWPSRWTGLSSVLSPCELSTAFQGPGIRSRNTAAHPCSLPAPELPALRKCSRAELPNGNPKEGPFREDQCPLEAPLPPLVLPVALPAEKAEGHERPGQLSADDGERAANCEGPRGPGGQRLNIDALQCDVSVEDDDRQEWTFTLYDFDNCGKVTREDMSSLMHTIYEVVDASVNHSSGSSKTLRVKLTVSPEPSSKRKEGPPAGQDREPNRCRTEGELPEEPRVADRRLSAHVRYPVLRGVPPSLCGGQALLCASCRRPSTDPQPCSERGPYCVDENTERRNHYLDLAGIENYTSRFGPATCWS
ncbi:protein naked cuticle homolog 2 isoform X14 [Rhinopithecus roxellana]|uniref:protein naked cuticle homolog 2 isoform X14 n=1 Tax=Rhinopithecus roxellana TaxID=61622 RepID=UPI0012376962|nr:protein naked cuticle homolog 2 isoform X14 [Rhinopithecus roxellana]